MNQDRDEVYLKHILECIDRIKDSRVGRSYYRVLLASVQPTLPTFLHALTYSRRCVSPM